MITLGAAWQKTSKNGKDYLSVSIDVPFLGKLQLMLFRNENKQKPNHPDYNVVWGGTKENTGLSTYFPENDEPF